MLQLYPLCSRLTRVLIVIATDSFPMAVRMRPSTRLSAQLLEGGKSETKSVTSDVVGLCFQQRLEHEIEENREEVVAVCFLKPFSGPTSETECGIPKLWRSRYVMYTLFSCGNKAQNVKGFQEEKNKTRLVSPQRRKNNRSSMTKQGPFPIPLKEETTEKGHRLSSKKERALFMARSRPAPHGEYDISVLSEA